MVAWYWVLVGLPVGALTASYFENKLNYNLVDLIQEKVLKLFGVAKVDLGAVEQRAGNLAKEVKKDL